jgi:hypothetical protein
MARILCSTRGWSLSQTGRCDSCESAKLGVCQILRVSDSHLGPAELLDRGQAATQVATGNGDSCARSAAAPFSSDTRAWGQHPVARSGSSLQHPIVQFSRCSATGCSESDVHAAAEGTHARQSFCPAPKPGYAPDKMTGADMWAERREF